MGPILAGSCKLRHEFLDTGEEARMVWMRDHASAQRAGEADEEDPFEHGDDDGETEARQAQVGTNPSRRCSQRKFHGDVCRLALKHPR